MFAIQRLLQIFGGLHKPSALAAAIGEDDGAWVNEFVTDESHERVGVETHAAGNACVVLCTDDRVLRSRLHAASPHHMPLRWLAEPRLVAIAVKTQNVCVALLDAETGLPEVETMTNAATYVHRPLHIILFRRDVPFGLPRREARRSARYSLAETAPPRSVEETRLLLAHCRQLLDGCS